MASEKCRFMTGNLTVRFPPGPPRSTPRSGARSSHSQNLARTFCLAAAPSRARRAGSVSSVDGRPGHPVQIVRRVQEAVDAVVDDFGQAADARRHDRYLARHRLERGQAEALLRRRQQEDIGDRQQRQHLILFAEEVHAALEPELAREPRRAVELRAVAHHQQVGRHAAADAIEDLDDRRRPA